MKYALTVILLIIAFISKGQLCDDKHILTGPSGSYGTGILSPTNPENSSNVSRFNWMLDPLSDGTQFRFTPVNGTTKYLLSPWHVSDPNIDYFNLAKGTTSDYKAADGWELFKVNLGRLNDDVTMRLTPTLVAYIMLYNRYTGTLRVFGYLDRTSDYHQMVVSLTYDSKTETNHLNYSALLSLNNNEHQSLDTKTKAYYAKAVTRYSNNQYLFFWTDFPLAYDPCVCAYQSNLTIQFRAVTSADIKLTGSIIGNIVPIATEPSGVNIAAKLLSSVVNIAKGVYTGNFTDFATAASTILGFTNLGSDFQEGLNILLNSIQLGLTLDQIDDAGSRLNTRDSGSKKDKTEQSIAAISTYFSALGKTKASSTMALSASAILNGNSLVEQGFGNSPIRFSTPGSKESHLNPQENYNNTTDAFGNVRPEYVAFNEILGTFALLKKPVINLSYANTIGDPCGCDPHNIFYVDRSRIRFQIPASYLENGVTKNNPILYALNPIMHANMAKTEVKVAVLFKKKLGSECSAGHIGVYNTEPMINLSSLTTNYPNYIETITPVSYDDGYSIAYYDHTWQAGPNNVSGGCSGYEFMSPLVPLRFIYDLNGQISLFGSFWQEYGTFGPGEIQMDEVLLKFYIDFESTDIGTNGQSNKSTLVFTYPMQINRVSEFPIAGPIDLTQSRSEISPVTSNQISQFCTTQLENATYKAKDLDPSVMVKTDINNNLDYGQRNSATNLLLSPNPSGGTSTLNYVLNKEVAATISVFNSQMQKVMSDIQLGKQGVGKHAYRLNLNQLPQGIYFVRLTAGTQFYTTRFLIQRQ